ncbi:hypothetical protein OGR47_08930 [Methylocystis sp. MJC1]|jgi:hypothetical protein|uniref:hypothetical protein n=1 Tax=Methylocystis sp. MJC1 TaxID=2654282 RepID=UPI0013ED8722|nr:hypothetical protein [Methylocystis sp. MJC1]KAF2991652.1 hypothetical protein MJC1_01217 [Methylocystis sp. MJC1]MBU6527109.1 hypothetical protein [Methylocystis sp. MJC1]UZX13545.1 hypothetical protein OGR47_08930 [Methylocystis sp. MJC1]
MLKSKLLCIGLATTCLAQPAFCAPTLEATSLYKDIAHGCRSVDLKQWSHPTRRVLDYAHIELKKVELCNNELYPVFTVRFAYDPNGPNDKYFNKLYADMAAANGYHAYSLVDQSFGLIANVGVAGKKNISISYEEFSPTGTN